MRPAAWPDRQRVTIAIGFAALCCGMFMAVLDVQIVATALPTLEVALGITPEDLSWVQTSYLLAEVVSIPLTGRLTRALGLRRLVVCSLLGFTVASAGCAASPGFGTLIASRLLQGFMGGMLIPLVFSSVFLLFRPARQPLATALAGTVAVLAPTVGPLLGGYVTATLTWHWLFLINLPTGFLAIALAAWLLPDEGRHGDGLRSPGLLAIAAMAACLATLVLALKQGPEAGWWQPLTLALFAAAGLSGTAFVRRTLASPHPLVALRLLGRHDFAAGCLLSFVFGMGLYGSVYLMPVFLGFVRGHGPLDIGRIMLVTGVAQLVAAPLAALLEPHVDARLLTGFGFVLFACGLGLGATETVTTDFDGLLWPQILRGAAIMFCLVPTTRLALGKLSPDQIPDASGLFNLMRNLGGAIGLAVIDTFLYGRAPVIAHALTSALKAGSATAAVEVGLPPALVAQHAGEALDPQRFLIVERLIGHAALTQAANEAWATLAVLTVIVSLVLLKKPTRLEKVCRVEG